MTAEEEARCYLGKVLLDMATPIDLPAPIDGVAHAESANAIFYILTSRPFCYLSRTKAEFYRESVVPMLERRIATGGALRFFYDIGPGYHASTKPGVTPLCFDVGLAELLILSQISALCRRIAEPYPPGAKFYLVIDNLCGLRTNDVSLDHTQGYVAQLRRLIESLGLSHQISLIVESEEFALAEYDRLLAAARIKHAVLDPAPDAVENVSRFLGRVCTSAEASARMELYQRTGAVTDALVDGLIRDVHMTQRATGATIGFRPFPGGDQRTQAGELVLTRNRKGNLRPMLVTSRNIDAYELTRFDLSDLLPPPLIHVTYAEPRAQANSLT